MGVRGEAWWWLRGRVGGDREGKARPLEILDDRQENAMSLLIVSLLLAWLTFHADQHLFLEDARPSSAQRGSRLILLAAAFV